MHSRGCRGAHSGECKTAIVVLDVCKVRLMGVVMLQVARRGDVNALIGCRRGATATDV